MDSRLPQLSLFEVTGYLPHARRNKILTRYVPEQNVKIYDLPTDLKTCCHNLFEMLSSNLHLDSKDLGYFRYCDLKEIKPVDNVFFFIDCEPASSIAICSFQLNDKYADMRIFM